VREIKRKRKIEKIEKIERDREEAIDMEWKIQ
jgi:hypothetical protein